MQLGWIGCIQIKAESVEKNEGVDVEGAEGVEE